MENVIDIRIALEQLGTGWQFGGSVTAGTQEAWNAVLWEGTRSKPSWGELCAAHATATTAAQFIALRSNRDALLADTDKMLLPDYPITAEALAQVKAYRAALRALPEQPGAPWDGGGAATPWPAAPSTPQAEQPCA